MSYKRLGDYIIEKVEFNEGNKYDLLQGVSNNKYFQKAKTNTIGVDLSKYRVAHHNQFVFNRATTRNGDKISIALRKGESCIVSPSYRIFEVKDENVLNPDYLLMWFKRPEFDRYARFKSHGSAHEFFDMEEMNEVELPIPSIEKQREIVAQYQAIENKIKVNEQICEKLEATAQTLYKQWFVDFEFPCLPSGYRPHGQVNQNLPIDEYITKIGSVCTYSRVGGLPVSDGKTWFVYLILCENDSVYKGITNDLYRRFYEHYMGEGAEWTKLNKPLKVIHWESFATKEEAAKREKDLKTGYGRTWISRQIEKAGGITQLKTSLPAPQTELRTAGKMVYNQELEKEIPEGWEVKKINSIAKVKHGYAFLGEDFSEVETEKVLVSPGNFKISGGFNFEKNKFYLGQINKNYILKKNDLIVNMTDLSKAGDTLGNTAFIPNISFKILLHNQRVGLFCFDEHFYNYYVYLLTQSKEYKHYILGTATGTTVRHTSPDRICDYDFIKPNMDILVTFNKIIEPIMNKIGLQISIKYKLTQLQSLLLSRLARLEGN